MSGISSESILFCRYCFGKRFEISLRWESSITTIMSAHSSCVSVTGFLLYSPAERVLKVL